MDEYRLLIAGRLVPGDSSMDVINPANETIVARAPRASVAQLDEAVAAAKAAFPKWRAVPLAERRRMLVETAERLTKNKDALARILTLEQGKPLGDAAREVLGAAGYFRYFATLDMPGEILEDSEKRKIESHYAPLGVVAAIVPWNFPLALMGFKVPAALIAGNTVVLKPAATTPLATLKFAELVHDISARRAQRDRRRQ